MCWLCQFQICGSLCDAVDVMSDDDFQDAFADLQDVLDGYADSRVDSDEDVDYDSVSLSGDFQEPPLQEQDDGSQSPIKPRSPSPTLLESSPIMLTLQPIPSSATSSQTTCAVPGPNS